MNYYPSLMRNFWAAAGVAPANPVQFSVSLAIAAVIILLLYALFKSRRSDKNLKYEFVTIIAHKFRTPLAQMKWTLEEIVPAVQDPFQKKSLRDLQQMNEKLIRLTATLIELADSDSSAKSAYRFEKIDLREIVRGRGEALRDFFHEKNLFFSVQCGEEPVFVMADRNRLEFVLQTVMENAGIYSPPGRNIEIVVYREGRKALAAVVDHGIGMDRLDLMRVFSRFFRAKNARAVDTEGFGVGLFLAQSVMHRHRGEIRAFSKGAGQGSTFVVSLPVARK